MTRTMDLEDLVNFRHGGVYAGDNPSINLDAVPDGNSHNTRSSDNLRPEVSWTGGDHGSLDLHRLEPPELRPHAHEINCA